MKNIIAVVALSFVACFAAQAAAATVAKYDPSTGELFVENEASIGVIGFNTAGRFNLSAAGKIGNDSPVQYDADNLAYFNANGLTAGNWPLGAVLPTGLGVSDINFAFTPIGADTVVAPVEIISTVIPEPTSLALIGFAGVFAGLRRRQG